MRPGAVSGTNTWTNTYNANGMRTKRTDGTNTYEYIYNGDKLMQMKKNGEVINFTYVGNMPATMTYQGNTFYYVVNAQGDVTGMTNSAGKLVVSYTYDAWGRWVYYIQDTEWSNVLGGINPLLYRGYVYDHETGLYYLQSRYYDYNTHRFLNADAFAATGQGMLGNNMFAYCDNNPVNGYDPHGMWTITLSIGADLTLLLFGVAISYGIAIDDEWNIVVQRTDCFPNYINNNETYYIGLADVGAAISLQWTTDDTVYDLEGPSTYIGGSLGVTEYFSVDMVYSGVEVGDENAGQELPSGFQINFGVGYGVDLHYRQSKTKTIFVIRGDRYE